MSFSAYVWDRAKHIYRAIVEHPFNQELMLGTLAKDKFTYFLEQDCCYLNEFAKCMEMIALRAPKKYINSFMHYRYLSYEAITKIIQQFSEQDFSFSFKGPATVSYSNHLKHQCSNENYAVAV